jgi:hypothetical protein
MAWLCFVSEPVQTTKRACSTNSFTLCDAQIDYANDEQWNIWVKAGVWKLLSSDGKSPGITNYNDNNRDQNAASISPHQSLHDKGRISNNPITSTVTPLQTSCDMPTYMPLLDLHSGEEYLDAMDFDFTFEHHQEPRVMTTNIQVSE